MLGSILWTVVVVLVVLWLLGFILHVGGGLIHLLLIVVLIVLLYNLQGGEKAMPRKKPLKGVGEKEERQYEHIKESAEKSGRYGNRAEEVAARTVMKQHKQKGHKKGQ